ncbi:cytokine receptor common subunit gamma-like [Arapaima gigas]
MLFLLLVLSVLGGGSCSSPDVQCLIINLEYLKCTWSHGKLPEVNYTFSFKFSPMRNYMNCSRYLQEGGPNIGCIIDKPDRFKKLYINLSHSNGTRVWDQQFDMVNKVKLNPPHNLSVEVNRQNQELWLYWNHSVKSNCRENQVMYRRNEESQWQFSTLLPADFYSLPQASLKSQYEFKVKTRVSNTCGMSEFWSDWGPPVWWYPAEQSNQTGPELGVDFQHKDRDAVTPGRKVLYPVMEHLPPRGHGVSV